MQIFFLKKMHLTITSTYLGVNYLHVKARPLHVCSQLWSAYCYGSSKH